MKSTLKRIYGLFDRKERQTLIVLFCLGLTVSIIETLGISLLVPFIAIATTPKLILENLYLKTVFEYLNLESTIEFVVVLGIMLIVFFFIRAIVNLVHLNAITRFSNEKQHKLKVKLFSAYINSPYKSYVKRNSAEYSKDLMVEANHTIQLVLSFLNILSESMIVILLVMIMFVADYKIAMVVGLLSLMSAFFILKPLKSRIKKIGILRTSSVEKMQRTINEAFSNFKLVKLVGNQDDEVNRFSQSSNDHKEAINSFLVWSVMPKYILESVGFSTIVAIVIYSLVAYENPSMVIGIISLYAVAFYRLLPSLNKILSNLNQIRFYENSLGLLHGIDEIKTECLGDRQVTFNNSLEIKNLSFSYGSNRVLDKVNLNILKKDKVAFIGESGSGKSTFVSLIMGLHQAKDGLLALDGASLNKDNFTSWRSKIGYIPQDIYLFDGTVAENVVYGRPYSDEKLKSALKSAKIYDFLSKKQGIDTKVGEGGVQLSGGQKQRIAIARALYSNPELLILDEATSALDTKVEKQIMDEIYELSSGMTLIVVAHRLSTISSCNKIIRFEKGKLTEVSSID